MSQAQEQIEEFVVESLELIENAVDDVLGYRSRGDEDALSRVFRAVYVVKTNARQLGFENLGYFAQLLELLVNPLRREHPPLDAQTRRTTDLLLEALQAIKLDLEWVQKNQRDPTPPAELLGKLEACFSPTDRSWMSQSSADAPGNAEGPPPRAPLRILIAEDDRTCRTVLSEMLAPFGLCEHADDGEQAVRIVEKALNDTPDTPFDLICMDIMMPRMDGMEAVSRIRRMEELHGLFGDAESKIIMTTALRDPRTVVKCLYQCGANAFMVKPVRAERITRQIKRLGLVP